MSLTKAITSHHTVWVSKSDEKPVAARYGTTETELVCFGDAELASLSDGDIVKCTVHEIAAGPPLESFEATVRTVPGEELALGVVASVHGNAPDPNLGVNPYIVLRDSRRFLGLLPTEKEEAEEPT